ESQSRPSGRLLFFQSEVRQKVFNTTVENTVEKRRCIFVSDSASDGSAFCTGASAGTFGLELQGHATLFVISQTVRM
ncbi:MAG: hypothetical protein WA372_17355, partial [Candidatus Sulfotelmatobacter sp.]